MKKIFTLISVALVAMSINAQEVFDITTALSQDSEGRYSKFADGQVKTADNVSPNNKGVGTEEAPLAKGTTDADAFAKATAVTLTDYVFEVSTANCTMKMVSTPNANDNTADNAWGISDQTSGNANLATDACSPKFNVYVSGKGNPTATYFGYWVLNEDDAPSFRCPNDYQTFWTPEVGAAPSKGSYTTFKVSKEGVLKIGVRIPKAAKNRKVYFVNQSTGAVLEQDKYNAEGYNNNNTQEYQKFTTTDYIVATDVNNQFIGYINVTLPVNETYVMFSPDTQIGIYGFQLGGESAINTIKADAQNANAATYNLAGQRVSDSYKGLVIKNGQKMIKK